MNFNTSNGPLAQPPRPGPKLSLRTRVLARLLGSPWVWGPFLVAGLLLLGTRMLGARVLLLDFFLLCFGLLQFAIRLLLGFESLEKQARMDEERWEFLTRETLLDPVATRLDSCTTPSVGGWLRGLRAVYWSYKNAHAAGQLPAVPTDAARQVDRLYDALIRRILMVHDLVLLSESTNGAVHNRIERQRTEELEQIEPSIASLTDVIFELRSLGHGQNSELARLQNILDTQLKIAKATDQRMSEILGNADLDAE